jgi:hypothetical protein
MAMTRKRTSRDLVGTLGAALLLGAWASPAAASPGYPAALQEASGSPCPPPCTVCHLTTNGGSGTAIKPFAESMIEEGGLDGEDDKLVAPAVKALAPVDGGSAGVDSDDDGMNDIAELAAGRDPNVTGAGELCGPTYGCGARIEPSGRLDWPALALALGVIALLSTHARRTARSRRGRQRDEQ